MHSPGPGDPAPDGPEDQAPRTGTKPPAKSQPIVKLPMETQTIYAELVEHMRGVEFLRTFADIAGAFKTRERGNARYWYFRTSEGPGDSLQEFYIGPDDAATQKLIETYQQGRSTAKDHADRIQRLASMLRGGGITLTDSTSARIIKGFSAAGVFRLGGVLVGTHAFVAIGNTLGVRWPSALQTQDVDFGALANPHIGLGVPQSPEMMADVPKAIDALAMGFVPNIRIHVASKPTTYVVPGKEWRIDLVTAPQGADREAPVEIPRLRTFAQPLEFMDYLLEKTMEAVIVGTSGVLVRVPEPARFAVHKLLVASNRDPRSTFKAGKDRQQAYYLMSHLQEERPGDITLAAEDALRRGPSWRRRIKAQANYLPGRLPELEEAIR